MSAVEHWGRLTEQEAQLNVRRVLELCAPGEGAVQREDQPPLGDEGAVADALPR